MSFGDLCAIWVGVCVVSLTLLGAQTGRLTIQNTSNKHPAQVNADFARNLLFLALSNPYLLCGSIKQVVVKQQQPRRALGIILAVLALSVNNTPRSASACCFCLLYALRKRAPTALCNVVWPNQKMSRSFSNSFKRFSWCL
jgi:hypothetical protein